MMASAAPSAAVMDLKARIAAIATSLISRDGLVLGAALQPGMYADVFGVMCATIFGAAATANSELGRALPERIVISGDDSTLIIMPSGGKAILVVVLDGGVDPEKVLDVVAQFATVLGSNWPRGRPGAARRA